jgi:hypothetical protein
MLNSLSADSSSADQRRIGFVIRIGWWCCGGLLTSQGTSPKYCSSRLAIGISSMWQVCN